MKLEPMLHSQVSSSKNASVSLAIVQRRSAVAVAIMLAFAPPTKMSPCCPCLTPLLLFPAMTSTGLISREVLVLLLLATAGIALVPLPCHALQLQDAALIDDVVMEAAEEWFNGKHRRTGVMYPLSLPGSLSAVDASVSRFRAGSLKRYGVHRFGEFSVPWGLVVSGSPAAHLLAVRVNLGNLSAVYAEYAARGGGYRIASPVLGLMFYGLEPRNGTAPLEVRVTGPVIRVNFSMAVPALQPGVVPLCMAMWLNGSVTVTDVQAGSNTCHLWDQGHVALVLGGVGDGGDVVAEAGEANRWKLALFGAALGAGGTVLLGLVLVALLSVQRRKSEMAEMERRAYEEEALRVAMVGHVRAPSASGSRTTPDELENEYRATL